MTVIKGIGQRWKRIILVVSGTLLGIVFFYLAFRGITWSQFVTGMEQMQPIYLIPSAVLIVLIQLVRALRFGVIVSPFCEPGTKAMWDLLNIWSAANMVMPARLAEFVRPYLLQRTGVAFSSSFGAVMVERFFDLFGLLLLLGVVLWKAPEVPPMYSYLGLGLLVTLSAGYVFVLVVLARTETVLSVVGRILSVLPERLAHPLEGIIRRLIEGFGIMASLKQVMVIFAYSLLLWILFAGMTYLFLVAFSIKASFLVAVTIQVFVCFGIALPSAPGFVGTFHAAGRYALALFGVPAVAAVSFATAYHLFNLLGCLALGGLSYLTSDFRFGKAVLVGQVKSTEPNPA